MDELQAVGDPQLRAALLFARRRAAPVTADELAEAQGIHRNVARSRLERLVEAGLLRIGFERRTGRSGPGAGRPAKTYAVAPELRAVEFPPRRYDALAGHLLDALPARARAGALRAIGAAFAADLAESSRLKRRRTLRGAAAAVCDALRRLGYHASVAEIGGDSAVITTSTCPLRPLVRANPDAAAIDTGMWATLTEFAGGWKVGEVSCDTHGCLGDDTPCTVRLQLRQV